LIVIFGSPTTIVTTFVLVDELGFLHCFGEFDDDDDDDDDDGFLFSARPLLVMLHSVRDSFLRQGADFG
jgi:hypothetical protein